MYWAGLLMLAGVSAFDYNLQQGFKLVETTPRHYDHVTTLHDIARHIPVDIWSSPHVGGKTEIFVAQEFFGQLKSYLYSNGLEFTVSNRDVTAELKQEWEGLVARGRLERVYNASDYNTYEDINTELDRLAAECPTTGLSCSTSDFGTSFEGRILRQITVSSGNGAGIIVLDSLIHAREWISGATLMVLLEKVITEYGINENVTRVLDKYDFVFAPILNPDGYVYSWETDRLFRKSRTINVGSECIGVDLNRNYDYMWGDDEGSSGDPCEENYRGASAASEPETVGYVALIESLTPVPTAVLTLHAYGRYLLNPYGDCTDPPEADDVEAVSNATCAALEATFGEEWLCGGSCEKLYPSSGSSQDWFTGGAGIKYSFTVELRHDGGSFHPPPYAIGRSVEQMWDGILAMVDEIDVRDGM